MTTEPVQFWDGVTMTPAGAGCARGDGPHRTLTDRSASGAEPDKTPGPSRLRSGSGAGEPPKGFGGRLTRNTAATRRDTLSLIAAAFLVVAVVAVILAAAFVWSVQK